MSTMILGFSGRARHGKTEACEAIKLHVINGGGTAVFYDIGNLVRLWCIDHGHLPQVERKAMTREQLQVLIDWGKKQRGVSENFWLDQMFKQIIFDAPDVALIPNLRYWNEVDEVVKRGGHIVRVTRLTRYGTEFISPDRDPNDISETALDHCWETDFYITVKEGQAQLVRAQAVAIYQYLNECGRRA